MKKSHIYILLANLLFTSACHEPGFSVKVSSIIKNETAKDVVITAFFRGEPYDLLKIASGESDSIQGSCAFERGSVQNCDPVLSLDYDSVRITFNDEKRLTYCNEDDCGLINGKNLLELNIEDPSQNDGYEQVADNVFVFTIEESDYELAEPIE